MNFDTILTDMKGDQNIQEMMRYSGILHLNEANQTWNFILITKILFRLLSLMVKIILNIESKYFLIQYIKYLLTHFPLKTSIQQHLMIYLKTRSSVLNSVHDNILIIALAILLIRCWRCSSLRFVSMKKIKHLQLLLLCTSHSDMFEISSDGNNQKYLSPVSLSVALNSEYLSLLICQPLSLTLTFKIFQHFHEKIFHWQATLTWRPRGEKFRKKNFR